MAFPPPVRAPARVALLIALFLYACSPKPSPTSFYNHFSGMALDDQDGRRLDPGKLLGRTVLVSFVFTGCSSVCPMQTRALVELQQKLPDPLRERVQLLSVSIDPRHDTPAALKAYAESLGVDLRHWSFVTGSPADVQRVSDALSLFRPGPDVRVPDDHATTLWLIDPAGELRMRYRGNPPDVPRLVREITSLDALAQAH